MAVHEDFDCFVQAGNRLQFCTGGESIPVLYRREIDSSFVRAGNRFQFCTGGESTPVLYGRGIDSSFVRAGNRFQFCTGGESIPVLYRRGIEFCTGGESILVLYGRGIDSSFVRGRIDFSFVRAGNRFQFCTGGESTSVLYGRGIDFSGCDHGREGEMAQAMAERQVRSAADAGSTRQYCKALFFQPHFSAHSLTVFVQTLCATACINICETIPIFV